MCFVLDSLLVGSRNRRRGLLPEGAYFWHPHHPVKMRPPISDPKSEKRLDTKGYVFRADVIGSRSPISAKRRLYTRGQSSRSRTFSKLLGDPDLPDISSRYVGFMVNFGDRPSQLGSA